MNLNKTLKEESEQRPNDIRVFTAEYIDRLEVTMFLSGLELPLINLKKNNHEHLRIIKVFNLINKREQPVWFLGK